MCSVELPLRLHEFSVPATKGVGSEEVRQPVASWTEPLENVSTGRSS
jgi:hypothetical protein